MTVQERTILTNTNPGHNKYYIIEPVIDGEYSVLYGRTGNDPVHVVYNDQKKNRSGLITSKLKKGYVRINPSFEPGDIVSVEFAESKDNAIVIDNFVNGTDKIRIMLDKSDNHMKMIVRPGMISMVRKIDEDNNGLYEIIMPYLMEERKAFMKKAGYLTD